MIPIPSSLTANGWGCAVRFPRSLVRPKTLSSNAHGDKDDAGRGDELTGKVELSRWSLAR
jgi:hypothetical protein